MYTGTNCTTIYQALGFFLCRMKLVGDLGLVHGYSVWNILLHFTKKHGVSMQKYNQQLCFFNKLAWFMKVFRMEFIF
jgi:hypothetical protein